MKDFLPPHDLHAARASSSVRRSTRPAPPPCDGGAEPAEAADEPGLDLPAPPAPRPLPTGARALLAGSTGEVIERLIAEDPFDLRARVPLGLARLALLLDPDVAAMRCASRIARFGRRYKGRPAFATWLDAEIDAALEDLVRSDARAALPGAVTRSDRADSAARAEPGGAEPGSREPGSPDEAANAFDAAQPHVARLARAFDLTPARACAVCRAHNERPLEERRAFRLLVLENRGLDESARLEDVSGSELGRRARRALDAVLDAADQGNRRRTR